METNIPPEILALLADLQAGGEASLNDAPLAAQYATAGKLRNTAQPQGRTVRDQYVAQNPLETLNASIMQAQGGQGQREAMDAMKTGIGAQGNAYKAAVMAEMLRRKQAAQTQPTTPGQTFAGDPSGSFPGP